MCDRNERQSLWGDLIYYSNRFKNESWVVVGDFNVTKCGSEHTSNGNMTKAMAYFNKTIVSAKLEDLRSTRFHYTWSNRRIGNGVISKKLDRAMGNWFWFKN
ncbi:Exo_endo_phos domain-containing protein [Cephalotus follicularis]|uniref:Exo_endo_phos domain-containing protein n=1 Tax=Cephalotus follicularis TaxID=3775 RepID=A0A1Q3AYI1_CEPFO|nr:Exo_endo_phos domain-containing protein [Cephalotus follicularis]